VRPKTFRAVRVLLALAGALALAPAAVRGGADDPVRERFQSLERAIQTDPENLELGASYRMLAIESEHLWRSAALAYPTCGQSFASHPQVVVPF